MIEKQPFSVSLNTVAEALTSLPEVDFRISLNSPTGDFFYDAWKIKEEFKNTVWEDILNSLPAPLGEARLIELKHGTCYMSHCDIDDRYHLNIEGQYSFLIDIDSQTMFPTVADGQWYVINTGIRHVAANFGSIKRTQLVVRHLLNKSTSNNLVTIKIFPICENPRFEFDDIISPWLNKMNKHLMMSEFTVLENGVRFKLSEDHLQDLELFPSDKFKIVIEK
jgi:hypothetical protein